MPSNGLPRTVRGLQVGRRGTTLDSGPDNTKLVVKECYPDLDAARSRLAAVRRINRVEYTVMGDGVRATLHGKRSRLPFVTVVSLPIALGLTALGLPTTMNGVS